MYDYTQIKARTIPEAHRRLVYRVWNFGDELVGERGDLIREILDMNIRIDSDDISHCDGGLNEELDNDFAEALIDPDKAEAKGKKFVYAYGERIWTLDQLNKTINRLIEHPTSRRAVIPIFDKIDNCMTVNEVPCWIMGQFILRDNKLHAEIFFRSNDVFGAFPADCYGIRKLQEYVVTRLNEHRKPGEPLISIGFYSHTITSAHIRMSDENAVLKFLS
jgi:thymidylate synthase